MKNYLYLFTLAFLLVNCSSEDDGNDPNNIAPGPFSVTVLETRTDGANIEWSEAIDIDDDSVTYSIYLNDLLFSTGGTALSYNFTGLEPETLYDGSIIADDGRGGLSQDDFFFVTEPEVMNLTVNASDWIKDSFPEAGGTREIRGAGFEVPFYADATSYRLEILNYSVTYWDGTTLDHSGTYTWTNETQNYPVTVINSSGNYGIELYSMSINSTVEYYDTWIASIMSGVGQAQVTIYF